VGLGFKLYHLSHTSSLSVERVLREVCSGCLGNLQGSLIQAGTEERTRERVVLVDEELGEGCF
jgi:hypothetical protein